MQPLIAQMGLSAGDEVPLVRSLQLMIHAIGSGMLLMLITVVGTAWAARRLAGANATEDDDDSSIVEIVLNSANVLFLSFGMAGVMLLVNNNLARAFAIGAAIALVRFRIKVSSKTLSMALFYGVLVGMACGVDRVHLAWGIAGTFGMLQLIVLGSAALVSRPRKKPLAQVAPQPAETQPVSWN